MATTASRADRIVCCVCGIPTRSLSSLLPLLFSTSLPFILSPPPAHRAACTQGASIKTYVGHGHEVNDVAIASDNSRIASCGGDKLVHYWDVSTGQVLIAAASHRFACALPTLSCLCHTLRHARSTQGTLFTYLRWNGQQPRVTSMQRTFAGAGRPSHACVCAFSRSSASSEGTSSVSMLWPLRERRAA